MNVILTQRVPSLGNIGEMVKVSPGYGRNYLVPRGYAVIADESNRKQYDHMKRQLAKRIEAEKNEALELKSKVEKVSLEVTKKVGGSGKLFGTVTASDISKLFEAKELEVPKRVISITEPIKNLGTFEVTAKLFEGVEAVFKITVLKDPNQEKEEKEKAKRKAEAQALKLKKAAEAKESELAAGENAEDNSEENSGEESGDKSQEVSEQSDESPKASS